MFESPEVQYVHLGLKQNLFLPITVQGVYWRRIEASDEAAEGVVMPETENPAMPSALLLPEETQRYLAAHPGVIERLQRAEKAYKIFGGYLNLTQPRVVVRESGSSTTEADLSATLLRTDR